MPVYNSITTVTGDGARTNWEINFSGGYLAQDHIFTVIDGIESNAVFEGASTVRITPPLATGQKARIFRRTPSDKPLADFANGARLTEQNLDDNARQAVFLAAEAMDRGEEGVAAAAAAGDFATEAQTYASEAAGTLIAIQQAVASVPYNSNVRFVSPTVVGTAGDGSRQSPWSFEYAATGAGGAIKRRDVVVLLGNPDGSSALTYRPRTLAGLPREQGFLVTTDGVTFVKHPGHRVVFADPIDVSLGFTKLTVDTAGNPLPPGVNIYESNFTIPGTAHVVLGTFTGADGVERILGALRNNEQRYLEATNSSYKNTLPYHLGPAMTVMSATRKLRIRLDQVYDGAIPAMAGANMVYPPSTDPALNTLKLYREYDTAIRVTGHENTFDGLEFNGWSDCVNDRGNSNTHIRCLYYFNYRGLVLGDTTTRSGAKVIDSVFDGRLRRLDCPIAWGDVKNGVEPLLYNRSQCLSMQEHSHGHAWGCLFANAFDGSVVLRPGWEFGKYGDGTEDLPLEQREEIAWQYACTWFDIKDDALQIGDKARGLKVHHCWVFGAGFSRDGTHSGSEQFGPLITIHHCVIDNRNRRRLLNKVGRNAEAQPDARYSEEGWGSPNAMPTHGEPSGATSWTFHWNFVYNTLYIERTEGNGTIYNVLTSWGDAAGNRQSVPNVAANNIIYDPGNRAANNTEATGGPITRFRPLNSTRIYAQRRNNILDGNAYIQETALGTMTWFQFIDNAAQVATAYLFNISSLRTANMLASVQPYYPPGWEASGVQFVEPNPALVCDQLTYRPVHPNVTSGAADITTLGIPQITRHQTWRGARVPASRL